MPKTKSEKTPGKRGRPSKFDGLDLGLVERLYKQGLTDEQVSQILQITEQTLNNFKLKHPDFFESIKDWKAEADREVEVALYKRATGYTCKDTKFATFEGQITDAREYDKHYPPDPVAIIFWLTNRQPDKWRRNQEGSAAHGDLADILDELAKERESGADSQGSN